MCCFARADWLWLLQEPRHSLTVLLEGVTGVHTGKSVWEARQAGRQIGKSMRGKSLFLTMQRRKARHTTMSVHSIPERSLETASCQPDTARTSVCVRWLAARGVLFLFLFWGFFSILPLSILPIITRSGCSSPPVTQSLNGYLRIFGTARCYSLERT